MADLDIFIKKLLLCEGGYQNSVHDKANFINGINVGTNKGITPATYKMAFEKTPTKNDMLNLTDEQFKYIVKFYYWDKIKGDQIKNQSVAEICCDWVYLQGLSNIKNIQLLLFTKPDGIFGNETLKVLNAANQEQLFDGIKLFRLQQIKTLVQNNKSLAKFKNGWHNRINSYFFYK